MSTAFTPVYGPSEFTSSHYRQEEHHGRPGGNHCYGFTLVANKVKCQLAPGLSFCETV